MHFALVITQDHICPWCYIGLSNVSRAISKYKQSYPTSTFSMRFKPFQLNDKLPTPGVDKAAYLAEHLGPKAVIDAARDRVRTAADKAGAVINPTDENATVGNTFNSHRLVWWAGGSYLDKFRAAEIDTNGTAATLAASFQGGQRSDKDELALEVVQALHKAYFADNKDISLTETLVEVAAEAGMDRQATRAFIEGQQGIKEVRSEVMDARKRGISGVPYAIINGYGIQGGIGVEGWLDVFGQVREMDKDG